MTQGIATDLLGKRIEMKCRGTEGSWWTDNRDSSRGPLVGTVRTVAVGDDGTIILHVEDEEGWVHQRSCNSHVFRIAPMPTIVADTSKWRHLGNLKIGDCFRFVKPPHGWFNGKLIIVEKALGWAMPHGWDFIVFETIAIQRISDERVELLDEPAPVPTGPQLLDEPHCEEQGTCECIDGCGSCEGCGRWLGDEPHRIKKG